MTHTTQSWLSQLLLVKVRDRVFDIPSRIKLFHARKRLCRRALGGHDSLLCSNSRLDRESISI